MVVLVVGDVAPVSVGTAIDRLGTLRGSRASAFPGLLANRTSVLSSSGAAPSRFDFIAPATDFLAHGFRECSANISPCTQRLFS